MQRVDSKTPEKKIIIFSGAGLDAPSGIATFRDSVTGMWNNFDVDVVCNINTFEDNFETVHEFYDARRSELKEKSVNCAHVKIAELQKKYPGDVINITTNVTDFFERLETPILHLHGELSKMKCLDCSTEYDFSVSQHKCPVCNSDYVKPGVIFFGENAPAYKDLSKVTEYLSNPGTVFVAIGASGEVIDIDSIVRHKPCKKILANKNKSKIIREHLYTSVRPGDIINTIDYVIEDIEKFWNL